MNIQGIGIDIEEIKRFKRLPYNDYKHFYERIFTAKEIAYCLEKQPPYPHFAVRFCAKEAAVKALRMPISYKDIEIVCDTKNKAPRMRIIGQGAWQAFVSLSHTKNYATALVVLSR